MTSLEDAQRASALQTIQAQFPSGQLPPDVIALAQAIQLLNLTKGASAGGGGGGWHTPSSLNPSGGPDASPFPSHLQLLQTASPSAGGQLHQSQSSPGIYQPETNHAHQQQQQLNNNSQQSGGATPVLPNSSPNSGGGGTKESAHHPGGVHMQRAMSSVNIGARHPPQQQQRTFPLTRW